MFPPYSGVAKKEVGRTMSVSAKHYLFIIFFGEWGGDGVDVFGGMLHLKIFEISFISD